MTGAHECQSGLSDLEALTITKRTAIVFGVCVFIGAALLWPSKRKSELRGYTVPSPDGKTYLVVDDNNGGGCGPILLDGKKWDYALHSPGPVKPGLRKIECGGEIQFEIKEGVTFHFDYWGP